MTMHLAHPSLSMGGKRKGKIKFRNAEEARKHRELESDWQDLQNRWGIKDERKQKPKREPLVYSLPTPVGRTNTHHIKSVDTGHSGPISSKPTPKYTGSEIKGISQMAKSNAVPVFNNDHIIEIARMRR